MSKRIIIVLIPILLLTACAGSSKVRKMPVTPQKMSCSNGTAAQITLLSPDHAKLTFEGQNYNLERTQTASGVQYGNSKITYWNKGIEAMITQKGGSATICSYIPQNGL